MPLMTTKLLQNRDELSNDKDSPYSLKVLLQVFLFLICALFIIYFYYGYSSHVQLQSWQQFETHINSTREFDISENSKWQPLSGTTFCFVNINADEDQDQVNAVHKTWLHQCNNSQFFTYKPLSKTLPYRAIFTPLENTSDNSFWELIYGFTYSFNEVSSRFDWYLNAHLDSFVFVQHLIDRLQILNPRKPIVIVAQTKQELDALTIISHPAMKLLAENLYTNKEQCPFDERAVEGLKRCFSNIGVEVFDERQLKLQLLEYDNTKWVDHLEHAAANNLLAITGLDTQLLYLIKLLSDDKLLHNVQSNSPANCSCERN